MRRAQGRPAKEIVDLAAKADEEGLEELKALYGDDTRRQVQDALARAERRLGRLEKERMRVAGLYEEMVRLGGEGIVLGVDEVGRGAVAGPLTVCAVALPLEPQILGLNDSKQLTPAHREEVAAKIAEVATAIGIAHIPPQVIDERGMAAALRLAMAGAIEDAGVEPDAVLIDGNPVHVHEREISIVKGDGRIACIAAASIVAKVTRDAMMVELDGEYPGYHLAASKGYASPDHIAAIRERGCSPIHRTTFCGNFVETQRLF